MRLFAVFLLGLTSQLSAETRVMSTADLWAIERIGALVASPNGSELAFTVTQFDSTTNQANAEIWRVAADGLSPPQRLTQNPGSDLAPVYSPDSKSLAFVSAREGRPAQLYLLPLNGGEARALTDWPLGVKRAQWLGDGTRMIVEASTYPDLNDDAAKVRERQTAVTADATQARASESRAVRYWDRYLTDGLRSHLFVLDVASGKFADLLPGFDNWVNFDGFEWDVNAKGTAIAYSANATPAPHRELNFDVFLLDIATRKSVNLTNDRPGYDARPQFSPDGQRIVFSGTRRVNVASEMGRLFVYDLQSKRSQELLPGFDFPTSAWRFSQDGKRLYFHGEQAGRVHLFALDQGQTAPTQLVAGGTTEGVAPLKGDQFAYLRQDFSTPAEIYSGARALTQFNAARLKPISLSTVKDVRYASNNGAQIQMFVAYPPGFSSSKKYPLLMLAHGGPFVAWLDSFNYRWNAQVFAAQGYVVAMPNWHGSTGFGQEFSDALLGAHGEMSSQDTLTAVDWLIAEGTIDPERMAIAGGSYGGYLTALLVGQTDRFKAAVNHAGVFDISGQFASDSAWDRPSSYGTAPWIDPIELDRWSPSRLVPKMNTPTLILHGELDYRVPVTQGLNMYGALTGKGVPTRIVLFPNENHWILKPQASMRWYKEFFDWLDRYL